MSSRRASELFEEVKHHEAKNEIYHQKSRRPISPPSDTLTNIPSSTTSQARLPGSVSRPSSFHAVSKSSRQLAGAGHSRSNSLSSGVSTSGARLTSNSGEANRSYPAKPARHSRTTSEYLTGAPEPFKNKNQNQNQPTKVEHITQNPRRNSSTNIEHRRLMAPLGPPLPRSSTMGNLGQNQSQQDSPHTPRYMRPTSNSTARYSSMGTPMQRDNSLATIDESPRTPGKRSTPMFQTAGRISTGVQRRTPLPAPTTSQTQIFTTPTQQLLLRTHASIQTPGSRTPTGQIPLPSIHTRTNVPTHRNFSFPSTRSSPTSNPNTPPSQIPAPTFGTRVNTSLQKDTSMPTFGTHINTSFTTSLPEDTSMPTPPLSPTPNPHGSEAQTTDFTVGKTPTPPKERNTSIPAPIPGFKFSSPHSSSPLPPSPISIGIITQQRRSFSMPTSASSSAQDIRTPTHAPPVPAIPPMYFESSNKMISSPSTPVVGSTRIRPTTTGKASQSIQTGSSRKSSLRTAQETPHESSDEGYGDASSDKPIGHHATEADEAYVTNAGDLLDEPAQEDKFCACCTIHESELTGTLKVCKRCKTLYCSRECQVEDWAVHKNICKLNNERRVEEQMPPQWWLGRYVAMDNQYRTMALNSRKPKATSSTASATSTTEPDFNHPMHDEMRRKIRIYIYLRSLCMTDEARVSLEAFKEIKEAMGRKKEGGTGDAPKVKQKKSWLDGLFKKGKK